jgi:type I restriction enzyme S subunit
MNNLGILSKNLFLEEEKFLKDVYKGYVYFAENDVLLAKITPCFENGKLGIARNLKNGIGFGSSEYVVFRSKGDINPEYLFYFLSRNQFRVEGARLMSGAVGHKRVPKEFIEDYLIPVPPLEEQKQIVEILDESFAGIERAEAIARQNLTNARELFDSYLMNVFLSNNDNWKTKKLEEICIKITDGKHGDCMNESDSGYYFLSAKDVKNNTLNYENARQITKEDFEETHRRTNLEPLDILITNSGTIGRTAIALDDPKTYKTTFQKSVAILKPKKNLINSDFCRFGLMANLSHFTKISAGTAQKNLLLRDIRAFAFSMPESIEEQKEIASNINAIHNQTKELEEIYQRKIEALGELKQSILQKAFSGQLTQ